MLLASLVVQSASPAQPAFDAASVKLLRPEAPKVPLFSGGPGSGDPGRLHLRVNMSLLLCAAFGISADQIKGPAWLRDFSAMPFYEIVATMPAATTKEEAEKMLQGLLTERFHLLFHQDTGNFAGYELIVDKGGPKLKDANPGSDGFPGVPGRRTYGWRPGVRHQRIKDQEWTMADLARQLGPWIGTSQGKSLDDGFFQPRVVDKTGLNGKYTFILEYACNACAPPPAKPSAYPDGSDGAASTTSEPGTFPDIFLAIQKQLGLKLVRGTDVPMKVVVVDALDKTPTEN